MAQAHSRKSGKAVLLAQVGVGLAGTFAFNRWAQAKAERDHPRIGHTIEIDGTSLHYVDRGTGTPIVLIHGNGSLVQDFIVSGLIDRLAARHRVIAFDRPGYGYTDRPRNIDWSAERQAQLFVDACDKIGIEKPVVFGHSWGTLPALVWALDHSDRIGALVLASGYYYPTLRFDTNIARIAAIPGIDTLFSNTIAPIQGRVVGPLGAKMIFSPSSPTPEFLEEMPFNLMLRPGQLRANAADGARMPSTADRLSERYSELDLPVTVIRGDGDKIVDPAQSAKLVTEVHGAQSIELSKVGHMVHHTAPEQVADAIEQAAASIANNTVV